MLTSRKQNAFPQKRRRVTAMRNIFDRRGNFKIIQIGADKNITRIFRRGFERQIDLNARMQTDSADCDLARVV
jgi:hypothetical protein